MSTSDQPKENLSLIPPNKTPSIYVEGLSQMMLGFPVSRVLLHSFAERDTSNGRAEERRTMAVELVMPTSSLIEMAQLILNTAAANKETLETSKGEWFGRLDALMGSVQAIDSPIFKTPSQVS